MHSYFLQCMGPAQPSAAAADFSPHCWAAPAPGCAGDGAPFYFHSYFFAPSFGIPPSLINPWLSSALRLCRGWRALRLPLPLLRPLLWHPRGPRHRLSAQCAGPLLGGAAGPPPPACAAVLRARRRPAAGGGRGKGAGGDCGARGAGAARAAAAAPRRGLLGGLGPMPSAGAWCASGQLLHAGNEKFKQVRSLSTACPIESQLAVPYAHHKRSHSAPPLFNIHPLLPSGPHIYHEDQDHATA